MEKEVMALFTDFVNKACEVIESYGVSKEMSPEMLAHIIFKDMETRLKNCGENIFNKISTHGTEN